MNKQELQQKLQNMESVKDFTFESPYEAHEKGFQEAKELALSYAESLDEPEEKPMLTKEEAEWVDQLTNYLDTPDVLYYITRCGYGDGFTFSIWGATYELPIEEGITYGELNEIRARLVDAVVYGYVVKKEKQYIVEIPNQYDDDQRDFALYRNRDGEVILNVMVEKGWRELDEVKLTEKEIKKNFAYLWEADLAKEVEE